MMLLKFTILDGTLNQAVRYQMGICQIVLS